MTFWDQMTTLPVLSASRGTGPVLIGVTLADKNDYEGLLERIAGFDPNFINLHENNTLYNFLV